VAKFSNFHRQVAKNIEKLQIVGSKLIDNPQNPSLITGISCCLSNVKSCLGVIMLKKIVNGW